MIQTRYLGELQTSAMGLGCMGMSEFYGDIDEKMAINVLKEAFANGITLFDTADIYGFGHNEKLLAKALKPFRQQVNIATKFGIVRRSNDPLYRGLNGHPDYVRHSCEQSLRRLKTDYIDLYYLHRVDPTVHIEDTIGAMSELVAEGKVRYIGISEASKETIRRANAIYPLSTVQAEYSLGSREVESDGILATTQQLDIGFVAYSPLCRALLTNDFDSTKFSVGDFRQHLPRFQKENITNNQRLIIKLDEFAKQKNCTLAQLSLAWLMAQSKNIVPIPGTKRLTYLKQNIAAMNVELSQVELGHLKKLLAKEQFIGQRYPDDIIKSYNLNG